MMDGIELQNMILYVKGSGGLEEKIWKCRCEITERQGCQVDCLHGVQPATKGDAGKEVENF